MKKTVAKKANKPAVKKTKKTTVKKLAIVAAICLCTIVLVLSFLLYVSISAERLLAEQIAADRAIASMIYQQTGRKAFGTINGEPFFEEDLNKYRSELRAAVAAYFGRVHNITSMGARFWDTRFNGITPNEHKTNLAINDLKRNMVIIQQARIRGIDTPDTYSDLEKERAEWNAPTDELIFGPRTLGPVEFTSYRIYGITNALKSTLLRYELIPTTDQLRASFNDVSPNFKTAPFWVNGTRFTWGESSDWERRAHIIYVSDPEKRRNEEIMAAIKSSMQQGLSAQEVVETLSALYPRLSYEEFTFNSRAVSRINEYALTLVYLFRDVAAGSYIPGPFDMPSLYYVTGKEGGGLFSFEEAPGLGQTRWINTQFEIFLNRKINEARVTLFTDKDF